MKELGKNIDEKWEIAKKSTLVSIYDLIYIFDVDITGFLDLIPSFRNKITYLQFLQISRIFNDIIDKRYEDYDCNLKFNHNSSAKINILGDPECMSEIYINMEFSNLLVVIELNCVFESPNVNWFVSDVSACYLYGDDLKDSVPYYGYKDRTLWPMYDSYHNKENDGGMTVDYKRYYEAK